MTGDDRTITPAEIIPAVRAVPGVVRLEPRLTDLATRLRRRIADLLAEDAERSDPAHVGVEISRGDDGTTTVVIDVATDGNHSALAVAREVRDTVRRAAAGAGGSCRVVVNVLTIEDQDQDR